MISPQLPTWTQRDNFRVDPHQALVDRISAISSLFPEDIGLETFGFPSGRGISIPFGRRIFRGDAVIKLNGPDGVPPLKREQYWAQLCTAKTRTSGDQRDTARIRYFPETHSTNNRTIICVNNRTEMPPYQVDESESEETGSCPSTGSGAGPSGSHGLRVGQTVEVFMTNLAVVLTDGPDQIIHNFVVYSCEVTPTPILARLTESADFEDRHRYKWVEQRISAYGKVIDAPGGISYDTEGVWAYNAGEGEAEDALEVGTIIELKGWTNCAGQFEYIFFPGGGGGGEGGFGTAKGQVHMMGTDTVAVWGRLASSE